MLKAPDAFDQIERAWRLSEWATDSRPVHQKGIGYGERTQKGAGPAYRRR